LTDVVKEAVAFAFKAGPQVGYQNLRSLVETDHSVLERVPVIKAGKVIDNDIHEGGC